MYGKKNHRLMTTIALAFVLTFAPLALAQAAPNPPTSSSREMGLGAGVGTLIDAAWGWWQELWSGLAGDRDTKASVDGLVLTTEDPAGTPTGTADDGGTGSGTDPDGRSGGAGTI